MLIRYGDSPQLSQFNITCNTGDAGLFSNVSENLRHGYPKFKQAPVALENAAVVCGSGPSLADTLENIRILQRHGARVFALNGAAKYLSQNGITVDVQILVDPRPANVDFVEEKWAAECWLASQCHPSVFQQCDAIGYPVLLWHPGVPGIPENVPSKNPLMIGGGITVGLSGLCLVFAAGHRELHLFGYDSSHRAGNGHAFTQDRNKTDQLVDCVVDSQKFVASLSMAAQAQEWGRVSKMLLDEGAEIHVHGDGLLPAMWRQDQRKKALRVLNAVYDLGVSPPTYDFISFLAEAERHRIANSFDQIDVYFQPGPMHGFRSDELPPGPAARKAMLWRICAGAARLLPSVKNIVMLEERAPVPGNIFPEGWTDETPVGRYGAFYQRDATQMLHASEYARQWASRYKGRYATITLREASYWPMRNSNIEAWYKVAQWLKAQGIEPLFIPDTESKRRGVEIVPEAAYDIDLRAALYEGAVINLGVSNGPVWVLPFLDARYMIFNIIVEGSFTATAEFLLSHGISKGDEHAWGGNGRVVWKPDTFENIIAELGEFAVVQLQETAS